MIPLLMTAGLAVGHTLAIYVWLIVGLRLVGRRQMTQLTPMEVCIVALLGSAVETGLYSGSGSLLVGLASAATLLLANRGVASLMDSFPRLRGLALGEPIVLVRHGRVFPSQLRRAHLTRGDVLQAARSRGLDDLGRIALAVLEVSGEIGIVLEEEAPEEAG